MYIHDIHMHMYVYMCISTCTYGCICLQVYTHETLARRITTSPLLQEPRDYSSQQHQVIQALSVKPRMGSSWKLRVGEFLAPRTCEFCASSAYNFIQPALSAVCLGLWQRVYKMETCRNWLSLKDFRSLKPHADVSDTFSESPKSQIL